MYFDISYTLQAMPRLLQGAVITVQFAVMALCFSTLIATVLSIIREFRNPVIEGVIRTYVSFIRGTPLLVQIFLIYYVLPLELHPVTAGLAALSLNSGAIMTEIMRGGLSAIPKGQLEAARSLGMRPWLIWWRIILPQMFILITPPMVNEFTLIVKSTPLLAVITVVELFRTSQQIFSSNFRPVEVLLGAAAIYFLINFTASKIAGVIERRNVVKLA
jgi:His/Glu/Gln/Arg/opine family amino acid ABC transporter permease subunit